MGVNPVEAFSEDRFNSSSPVWDKGLAVAVPVWRFGLKVFLFTDPTSLCVEFVARRL